MMAATKMANREKVIADSSKAASQGLGPMTGLASIRKVALKTFGWKSTLWLRQQIELMRSVMEMDRSTFLTQWWELATYLSPRRPRFLSSDVNKGWRRNGAIIDDTGGQALDTLAAGMMSGLSSPSRQWFLLTTTNAHLNTDLTVKDWLYDCTERMDAMFRRTNLYNELPLIYEDAGCFGTGAIMMEEDLQETMSFKSVPIGSYSIQHDNKGRVNKFYREFMMTVTQILDEFGERDEEGEITNWDNFSQAVRSAHDNHNLEYWFYVGHAIRPNHEYEPEAPGTRGKKYLDVYFERGQVNQTAPGVSTSSTGSEQWRFLHIKGYNEWPLLVLIWKKTGEDDYGTSCPGIRAIGDIRQLQAQERRISQATEKMLNPPMQGPPSLRGQRVSILPADITYVDQRSGEQGFRPSHEVKLDIEHADNRSQGLRGRINTAFYKDLFMMLQNSPDSSIQPLTAREVEEKHEEKLLQLAPVLEQANRGVFGPLVLYAFRVMMDRGELAPPPPAAKGIKLDVIQTSIFAQAIKLMELGAIERLTQFAASNAQLFPESMDNIDADQIIRQYADKLGIPPNILRTDKAIQAIRAGRAKQQQQQAQMAAQQQQAQTAKTLAQAPTGPSDQNALTQVLQQGAQAQSPI